MLQRSLLATTFVGLLTVTACHKTLPVASQPAPPAPVAAVPQPAPQAPRQQPARQAPVARVTEVPRSTTMTEAERITLNERLARLEDALFDYDKATIRVDATTALKEDVEVIRGILANYPTQKLVIEGHADERGSSEYNMALGDKRAQATQEFLTNLGIPQAQLSVISFGKDRPVCTEQNEGCYQKNRRTHITASR